MIPWLYIGGTMLVFGGIWALIRSLIPEEKPSKLIGFSPHNIPRGEEGIPNNSQSTGSTTGSPAEGELAPDLAIEPSSRQAPTIALPPAPRSDDAS